MNCHQELGSYSSSANAGEGHATSPRAVLTLYRNKLKRAPQAPLYEKIRITEMLC